MEENNKTAEQRIRRLASRLGHRLYKSRARLLHYNNQGRYMLTNDRNVVVFGDNYDANLEHIESYLREKLATA